jgi:transposase
MALTLTDDERSELERRVRSRKIRAEDARRGQVILMLANGESFTAITASVGCYPDYVSRWKQRFEAERVAGLRAKYRGQPATVRTPALEARVLAKTRQKPPDGTTHWTTRKLAKILGISHMLVARIWRRAGYQPHRFERYMLSDDPQIEEKSWTTCPPTRRKPYRHSWTHTRACTSTSRRLMRPG